MLGTVVVSSFDRFVLPRPIVTVDDQSTVVWLTGEQDLAVVGAMRDALTAATTSATAARGRPVIVDLRGVTFIDSTTARALVDATIAQADTSCPLTLRAPSKSVRRMLQLCGSGRLLDTA